MARQRGFDGALLGQQPIEGLVQLVDRDQAEHRTQRMARGRRIEASRGGQFGLGIDQPRDDQGQRQQPRARRARRYQFGAFDPRIRPKAVGDAERGGDVAMRQRAYDLETPARRPQCLVAQHRAECGDLLGLPLGQVGQGAVLDCVVLAISLAQQDGGGEPRFGTTVTYMRTCKRDWQL